jgi:hypothetical protein
MLKQKNAGKETPAEVEKLRADLARKIAAHIPSEGLARTAVPGLN